MKAALFREPGTSLELKEVKRPEVDRGEVLVKVSACGVCHTDLHYLDHGVPTAKSPPIILGHEVSGIIEETGDEVDQFDVGDRVLVPPVFPCGSCYLCRIGRGNICEDMEMLGNHRNGAYAEFVTAPARDVLHLPEEIPLKEGCVISDATSTPFNALRNRAEIKAGESLIVFGCGGLGLNTVQIASAMGASVFAVDIDDQKRNYAEEFGAEKTFDGNRDDLVDVLKEETGGGADATVEAIGKPAVMRKAFRSVRTGGRVLIMGFSHKDLSVNAGRVMFREVDIRGSLGCPPVLYPELFELVRTGKIQVRPLVTDEFPLSEINSAFDLLREGKSSLIRSIVVPNGS